MVQDSLNVMVISTKCFSNQSILQPDVLDTRIGHARPDAPASSHFAPNTVELDTRQVASAATI
jgi:hypothetical protein